MITFATEAYINTKVSQNSNKSVTDREAVSQKSNKNVTSREAVLQNSDKIVTVGKKCNKSV